MPAIKNRTVLEVAKNLKGFLNLDAGLTRGPTPNYEQLLKSVQGVVETQKRRLSEKDKKLARTQQRLSTTLEQAKKAQKQLLEKELQLQHIQQLLSKGNEPRDEELYFEIEEILDKIPIDLGGGCSIDKAYLFAWLIRRYGLKRTVDIGVYRGRSLFPQALAHAQFTGGVVYGVDPYSASEAKEENIESSHRKNKKAINRFIEQTDWQAIYQSVFSMKDNLGYGNHCVLLRETSANAAAYFETNDIFFDMVHVDGNHDTTKVMEDLDLYLPRVKKNGFVVLDDISFTSVRPAYEKLNAAAKLVYERTDQDNANDFAVFRVGPKPPNMKYNRRLWAPDFW